MSDTVPLFQLAATCDAQVDGTDASVLMHDFVSGAANSNFSLLTPTTATATQLDWNILIPGMSVYTSRRAVVKGSMFFDVTVSAVATSQEVTAGAINGNFGMCVPGRDFGVCAYPFNTAVNSAVVQLNSVVVSSQMNQYLPCLKKIMVNDEDTCPTQPDVYACAEMNTGFDDSLGGSNMFGNGAMAHTYLCATSVGGTRPVRIAAEMGINAFGPVLVGGQYVLGCLAGSANAIAASWTGCIEVVVSEPLLASPFAADADALGFVNMSQMQVRLTLNALNSAKSRILRYRKPITRVFLPANTPAATRALTITVNATQTTKPVDVSLQLNYLSAPEGALVPSRAAYPFSQFTPYSTVLPNIAAFTKASDQMSSLLTLATCPDMLAVWVEFPETAANRTDVQGIITKISVQWNNVQNLMATVPADELYAISKRNGLNVPFAAAWAGSDNKGSSYIPCMAESGSTNSGLVQGYTSLSTQGAGAPVLIRVNKDLPTGPGVAGGVAGNYTLQVRVDVVNSGADAVTAPILYVCPITSNYLVMRAGGSAEVITSVSNEVTAASTGASTEVSPQVGATLDMAAGSGRFSSPGGRNTGVRKLLSRLSRVGRSGSSAAESSRDMVKRGRFEY